MRKKFVASILAVAIAATSGCAEMGISKEQAGTVLGGLAGAILGGGSAQGAYAGGLGGLFRGGAPGAGLWSDRESVG